MRLAASRKTREFSLFSHGWLLFARFVTILGLEGVLPSLLRVFHRQVERSACRESQHVVILRRRLRHDHTNSYNKNFFFFLCLRFKIKFILKWSLKSRSHFLISCHSFEKKIILKMKFKIKITFLNFVS